MYVYTHTYTDTCVCESVCVREGGCVSVCKHTCVNTHTYIHTYIHIHTHIYAHYLSYYVRVLIAHAAGASGGTAHALQVRSASVPPHLLAPGASKANNSAPQSVYVGGGAAGSASELEECREDVRVSIVYIITYIL